VSANSDGNIGWAGHLNSTQIAMKAPSSLMIFK